MVNNQTQKSQGGQQTRQGLHEDRQGDHGSCQTWWFGSRGELQAEDDPSEGKGQQYAK